MSIWNTLRQAQTANDFAVTIADGDWSNEWIDLISSQTTGVDINLVWKRVTLTIRQLKAGYIQDLLFHILKKETATIDMVRITPARRQAWEMVFKKGKMVDHEVKFSYYDKSELVHVIVLEFEEVDLHSHEKHALEGKVELK